jgi:hypothetical protein
LWQFAGQDFDQEEIDLLDTLVKIDWNDKLSNFLTNDEIEALYMRIEKLIHQRKFPEPSPSWPAVPWPPV